MSTTKQPTWDQFSKEDLVNLLVKLNFTPERTQAFQKLTKEEANFVQRVEQTPGFRQFQAFGTDSKPLWLNPEKLGLIHCVGSYKWAPGPEQLSAKLE